MGMGPSRGRRPLVVVSQPNTADPDGWKRLDSAPEDVAQSVRQVFRKQFPHVSLCKDEEIIRKKWNYPDSAIRILATYGSNKGSLLIETDLNDGGCTYVDDPNDPGSAPWFLVTQDGQIRRIGSFMTLLDAGDYDNDGMSELIFQYNRPEDIDGFLLFDAKLHKRAEILWTYH